MDALALDDATVGAQLAEPARYVPADPWLARRALSFGASEVAVLLAALGRRPVESMPSYMQPDVKVTNRTRGVARIFAQKAGLVAPRKRSAPAQRGLDLEPRLVLLWQQLVGRGHQRGAETIDASSVVYCADALPRELLPLVDRYCPRLTCTPDVLVRDVMGALVCVDAKCTVRPLSGKGGVPAHYALQLQAQMAVCGAEWAAILEGEGWSAEWRDVAGEPAGPVRTWPVERDDALIAEIREAAEEGWRVVERLRAEMEVE